MLFILILIPNNMID
uniref:Uncharacterized protein n=1 Tax=Lepeophtheirus salmonis TaxID=72036 RepID=A0A0K2T1B0_LEPSM